MWPMICMAPTFKKEMSKLNFNVCAGYMGSGFISGRFREWYLHSKTKNEMLETCGHPFKISSQYIEFF